MGKSAAMPYDPPVHPRRSIRLRGYDYPRPGAYFITVRTQDKVHPFGTVVAGRMRLNACGRIVRATWNALPRHYLHAVLDAFVGMPNHVRR